MKKILILMLTAALALTMFGCEQAEQSSQGDNTEVSSAEGETENTEGESEEEGGAVTPDEPDGVIVADIPEESGEESSTTEEETGEAVVNFSSGIMVGSENLYIGLNVSTETLTALGEPIETQEAPSCHFDGSDTINIYDGFTTYLYKDGDKDVLYLLEVTSDMYTTALGAKVGMSKEEIVSIYGDAYEEFATRYSYTLVGEMVDFTFDESGVVTMIEFLEV